MSFGRLLREPFFQFLGLGFVVFVVMSFATDGGGLNREIHVSEADTRRLASMWEAQYDRAPTAQELESIIDEFIREEILVREARAVGLDEGDLIIRRRLAQKYEFLMEGRIDVAEPSDEVLAAWYREQTARYQKPAQIAFRHVYFSGELRGNEAPGDAAAALTGLRRDGQWQSLGDPFMLQREFAPRSEREVGNLFGSEFAAAAFELEEGEWSAPLRSVYGWHAVQVVQKLPETVPPFESIRDRVRRDHLTMQMEQGKRSEYEKLKAGYQITVATGNDAAG